MRMMNELERRDQWKVIFEVRYVRVVREEKWECGAQEEDESIS